MLPSEPPPMSRAALRRPRILLVDDDPTVLRALWRLLKNSRPDFKINGASGAAQALEALSELSYDAVITDLQMPGGGGQAVLEALAAHYPETARIVHSSQLESLDTAELRELAHAVLAKPASEAELVDAVEAALLRSSGRRSFPASSVR
ncbi:MAG TPA: response regulator [Polyangiaceae bacterium]|jgi:DNA-binding NarL/FixJ family response regulator